MKRMSAISACVAGLLAYSTWSHCFCSEELEQRDTTRENVQKTVFAGVKLTTQDGQEVDVYEDLVKGKIVLINFFYTTCDGKVCSAGARNLAGLQKLLGEKLGNEVYICSITLRPEIDTPPKLKEYATAHGAKPGWTFCTGNIEDITKLRRAIGLFSLDPKKEADPKQHMGMIKIGNEPFNNWSVMSVQSTPQRMMEMIERMKPTEK
jgi:protein SCO1/2